MSRPPRPHPDTPTYGELLVREGRLQMQPHSWQQLIAMQEQLADDELALVLPGGEADFTRTLFELSALVAHVLGKYQDHYASEAYLASAATTRSLLRHGWRLGYASDPGLAASGVVAITIGAGLAGELPEGLALTSAAKGERKAQKYETTEAREVDASWNSLAPLAARIPSTYSGTEVRVTAIGLELELGEPVVLVETGNPSSAQLRTITAIVEDPDAGTTTLSFAAQPSLAITNPSAWTLYAQPSARTQLFGWDADPAVYPPAQLGLRTAFIEPVNPPVGTIYGYVASGLSTSDVFLDRRAEASLIDEWLLISQAGTLMLARVADQRDVEVEFHAYETVAINVPPTPVFNQSYDRWITAPTSALELEQPDGSAILGTSVAPRAQLLHEFSLALPLASDEPNPAPLDNPLVLTGEHALEPGMRVVFSDRAESVAELIELVRVTPSAGSTALEWKRVTSAIDHTWTLGDLLVLGNVVAVSHGSSRSEVLGDSDGSTANQRFMLRKPRVTQLAGVEGATPALVVRVGGIEWTRVVDFGASTATDRHYRVELDSDQHLHVIFGDGIRGAVPAKGRRHIVADYRVGLGEEGNLDAGELTRLAQAHPLIESLRNPIALTGGSEPADSDAVQREATRWIRTFDRAVSLRDHADLALLYPGVARANAGRRPSGGVDLTVADAQGQPLADTSALRSFMQARRDTSVPLFLLAPQAVPLHLGLELELDPAFNVQLVEQAVRAALHGDDPDAPGAFTFAARELGQAAHLSQVYALLDAIAGVEFVRVTHFALTPAPPETVHDLLRVTPQQWISLAPINLAITSTTSSEET